MDNRQDKTNNFDFTVTRDGVTNSGISNNPPIVVNTSNTLSWSINDCSSSFQSVSSCETIGSYEQNTINTESPQVIIVPYITDNAINTEIGGTVITNNGVHCPIIKECSIRIDQLKMPSQPNFVGNRDETIIKKIIELPFSSKTTDCSGKIPPSFQTDDDSSAFEGFGEESLIGTDYELLLNYNKEAASLTKRKDVGPLTDRSKKIETVKRPRQVQRKISKPQLRDNQTEPINQSRIDNIPINLPTNQPINTMESPEISERISSIPIINLDKEEDNKKDSSSDSSDSDSDEVTPVTAAVTNPENSRGDDRSTDVKDNSKQKEIERMEKMRRRKELNLVADRIRDHWRETFAAAKRKQRKKAKKSKMENNKYKPHYTKNDIIQYQYRGQRKKKRVPYSSESDSSDTSNTSKSYSSSSTDSSDDSDTTHASDTTSQTSHVTDSDSSDTDSSDARSRSRHHISRRRMSSPGTTDTSDTSSEDDSFDEKRKFHLLKKAIYRKQSKSKNDDSCLRSKKRKSESYRSEHPRQKKKKRPDISNRSQTDSRRTKNNNQKEHSHKNLNFPSRSSAAKIRKIKSEFAKHAEIESTSAGDFSVRQCCFD